jgi:hypothetical protein
MEQRYRTLVLFLLSLGLVACATSMGKEPSLAVESFYKAASEGNFEELRRLYARQPVIIEDTVWSNGIVPIKTAILLAPSDDLPAVINTYTRNGTLTRVEIRHVRVMGDTASCRVRKYFKDGSTEDVTVELFRERQDGQWKIAWGSSTL